MSQNRAIVDKLLTNVSNKYMPVDYISEKILPLISVIQDSGLLAGYGNDHIRIGSFLHTGSGKYPRIEIKNRNSQGYVLQKHALSHVITEEDFANVEQPYDARLDATDHVTSLLWLEKEAALAATLTDTSVLTNNVTLSGTAQYNDIANSEPLEDFADAQDSIADKVGQMANLAVMSLNVKRQLKKHPDILDRLGMKHNRVGFISDAELAMAMDVDEVLVGKGIANTAKEGQADVIGPVWGKHIVFIVSPKAAAKRQISLGYRIQRGVARRVTKESLKDPVGAEKILIDDRYQQLISNVSAAFLIKDAIA